MFLQHNLFLQRYLSEMLNVCIAVEEPCCGRGTHRVPGEAESVHPRLPATATGGVMDREHTGGEIQRLGGIGTLQTPGDELVAPRGAGLGRAGSRAAQR